MGDKRKIIDAAAALELIRRAMEDRGENYVYNNHFKVCRNFIQNKPACIVGHGMGQLGLTVEECDNFSAAITQDAVNKRTGYYMTDLARTLFAAAQQVQDSGGTWGLAFKVAQRIRIELPRHTQPEADRVPSYIDPVGWKVS